SEPKGTPQPIGSLERGADGAAHESFGVRHTLRVDVTEAHAGAYPHTTGLTRRHRRGNRTRQAVAFAPSAPNAFLERQHALVGRQPQHAVGCEEEFAG